MDPHYSLQVPNSAGSSKAVSRPASTQPASSGSQPQSSRKRASHTVASPSQQPVPDDNLPAYRDVYSHPAAVAYAAAHPRRTIPKFGPYLLLQTLGEGEFGKVKLGLHMQWGEEVAVKLIRRGNIDSSARMSKVEREIEVLRTLKHPNIVRLYDVIETDKYIGIILEYASGGELFDHILAHRYLKEKDACKLFSQLISGVWYIHQKKIVHRDLKLENLLLDRHRNVIITDFGFANRFEHKADELMQTSCGSPCYAAPELVISDGMYVGSAVDVWSCGVILYAMLAGYLPFDDDPANPDGDNINLLYRYIVNTPLSFPDYVSSEARDLLSLMLVADPKNRADLTQVMSHQWLHPYSHLFSSTIGELEHTAMEQHQAKRLAYQKQMKASAAESHQKMSRSQSARTEGYSNSVAVVPSTRSRSNHDYVQPQQQEYLYETSIDQSIYSPVPPSNANRKGFNSQIVLSTTTNLMVDDDPFAPTPSNEEIASPISTINDIVNEGIQYRGDARAKKKDDSVHESSGTKAKAAAVEPVKMSPDSKKKKAGGFRHTIQVEYGAEEDEKPQQSNQLPSTVAVEAEKAEVRTNGIKKTSNTTGSSHEKSTRKNSVDSQSNFTKALPPTPVPATRRAGSKSSTTPESHPQVSIEITSPPQSPIFATEKSTSYGSVSNGTTSSKHKRGISIDKIGGLGKLFGGGEQTNGASTNGSRASESDTNIDGTPGPKRPSTLQVTPSQSTVASGGTQTLSPVHSSGGSASSSKKGRRNTLTTMAEPFQRTLKKKAKVEVPADEDVREKTLELENEQTPKAPSLTPKFANMSRTNVGASSNLASTSKAKKVMDWFRTKSKGKVPTDDEPSIKEKDLPSLDRAAGSSTSTVNGINVVSLNNGSEGPILKSSIPNHPHRTPSIATDRSSTVKNMVKNVVAPSQGPKNVLRVHHGAVDQDTITSGSPPEVMKHVREVLENMGLEVQEESLYKYRCVRPKRRKIGSTGLGLNLKDGSGNGLAAFSMVGSAASGGVDKRGLPVPSYPSGGTGMLKGLLMKRQSSQVSSSATQTSPNMDTGLTEGSNNESSSANSVAAIYGDQSQDQGGEVRFSVELTRLDRLDELYSLDIRRLKGDLKSYKFLYDSLRDRAHLQQQ